MTIKSQVQKVEAGQEIADMDIDEVSCNDTATSASAAAAAQSRAMVAAAAAAQEDMELDVDLEEQDVAAGRCLVNHPAECKHAHSDTPDVARTDSNTSSPSDMTLADIDSDDSEAKTRVPTPQLQHGFPTLVTFETKKLVQLFNTPEEDYMADIMAHLRRRELQLRPLPHYLSLQKGITAQMRCVNVAVLCASCNTSPHML